MQYSIQPCHPQQCTNLNTDSQEAYQLIKIKQYLTMAQKLIITWWRSACTSSQWEHPKLLENKWEKLMVYTSEGDPEKPDGSSYRGFKLWVTWHHQLPTQRIQNNHMDSENDKHMAGLSGQHIQHSVSSQMVWPFYLTSFPLGWWWSPSARHQPLDRPHGCLQAHGPGRQCRWHEKWWPGDASNSKYAE